MIVPSILVVPVAVQVMPVQTIPGANKNGTRTQTEIILITLLTKGTQDLRRTLSSLPSKRTEMVQVRITEAITAEEIKITTETGVGIPTTDSTVEIGTVEIGTVEIGTVEIGTVEIGTVEIGTVEIGTVEIRTVEIETTVKTLEAQGPKILPEGRDRMDSILQLKSSVPCAIYGNGTGATQIAVDTEHYALRI